MEGLNLSQASEFGHFFVTYNRLHALAPLVPTAMRCPNLSEVAFFVLPYKRFDLVGK